MTIRTALARTASLVALLTATTASAQSLADLEAAAKAEGMLTTIALPHDWCGYGDVIAGFKAKYPEITVNELNPDAGSADELEAVKANKDNKGPQAPGRSWTWALPFGPSSQGRRSDPAATKVSTWDEIPAEIKDADGHWYADYYGVMSFIVNKDLVENVPQDWADLLEAGICGSWWRWQGDPRASNQAILAVFWRLACRPGAAPGEAAGKAGLEFFKAAERRRQLCPGHRQGRHAGARAPRRS